MEGRYKVGCCEVHGLREWKAVGDAPLRCDAVVWRRTFAGMPDQARQCKERLQGPFYVIYEGRA